MFARMPQPPVPQGQQFNRAGQRDTPPLQFPQTARISQQGRLHLAPHTLANNRWRIERVIGSGGMGNVYLVRDEVFEDAHIYRALKEFIPRPELTNINVQQQLDMFRREAKLLATLNHPRIPRLFDFFMGDGNEAYFALEYIEGRDLAKVLTESDKLLSPTTVVEWMSQLCDIVQYLHMQEPPVVFRDLKPNNVMLSTEGDIHLIDFGIARPYTPNANTLIGTRGYAAPEMFTGHAEPRSDIYALGAMMAHLLTNVYPAESPLRNPALRTYNPQVSEQLEAVVLRCLAEYPKDRYQSAADLGDALDELLDVPTGIHKAVRVLPGVATGAARRGYNSTPIPGRSTQVRWRFTTEEEVRSTPVVANGVVYVGSYDNNLYAIQAQSGQMIWKFPTEGGICGTPVVWHDLVIFGSEDYNIYAVETRTGREAWRHRTWNHVRSSPRIYDDRLYIGSDDGHLYALDPREGRKIWRYRTYREVRSSAAYDKGLLYFGSSDEYLYAVHAETGEQAWHQRLHGSVISSPAIADGHLYVGSMDFAVYCLETAAGWQEWREPTEKFIVSSPVVVSDRVYIGSTDKHLHCLDRRTGQRLWRYPTNHQVTSNPAYDGNAIYFGSIDGGVYALDARYGKLIWHHQTQAMVPGSATVADGVVYIGSCDHSIYALEANP